MAGSIRVLEENLYRIWSSCPQQVRSRPAWELKTHLAKAMREQLDAELLAAVKRYLEP